MNVILHKDDNGNNIITYVAKGYDIKKAQEALGGVEISSQFADFEMDFINAYNISNNTISLNLEKAREIKISKLRQQRDELFLDFDKRYEIANRDDLNLTALKAERQKLKDIPQKAEVYLNSCVSIAEIKNLTINML